MDYPRRDWNTAVSFMVLLFVISRKCKNNSQSLKKVTNGFKRQMLYRNFVHVMCRGYPLGKKNRVVLYRCVVTKIREKYPKDEYTEQKMNTLSKRWIHWEHFPDFIYHCLKPVTYTSIRKAFQVTCPVAEKYKILILSLQLVEKHKIATFRSLFTKGISVTSCLLGISHSFHALYLGNPIRPRA